MPDINIKVVPTYGEKQYDYTLLKDFLSARIRAEMKVTDFLSRKISFLLVSLRYFAASGCSPSNGRSTVAVLPWLGYRYNVSIDRRSMDIDEIRFFEFQWSDCGKTSQSTNRQLQSKIEYTCGHARRPPRTTDQQRGAQSYICTLHVASFRRSHTLLSVAMIITLVFCVILNKRWM